MSSINQFYTFQYSQPNEYHFSHDSVFLARFVFEQMQQAGFRPQRVLDLCAGCGIVGLDYMFHSVVENHGMPEQCDFLEVQEVYREHFLKNLVELKQALLMKTQNPISSEFDFICDNYRDSKNENGYDLILCNPPYFQKGSGRMSPSEFKNRCRFFLDASEFALIDFIKNNLRPQGVAFVLFKKPELLKIPKGLSAQVVGEVRSTPVLRLLA